MIQVDEYLIECADDIARDTLKEWWQDLEARASNSFFLSWSWIETWLQTIKPDVDVLRAYHKDQLVLLGLIVSREQRRHLLLSSKTLRLHQTGDSLKDQMWIEYNGFLVDREHERSANKACVNYLMKHYSCWDEFIVGAITEQTASGFQVEGLEPVELWAAPTYTVNLAQLRDAGQTYLSSLSRNTRYQISRSRRTYEEQGELSFKRAESVGEALEYFDKIAPFHIERWGENLGESGFVNNYFTEFHRHLIRTCFEVDEVQLWELSVAGRALVYLYNFSYNKQVYFYLSGIEYDGNPKLKPGLLSHAMCIEHHLESGDDLYDFMGGEAQYKESLANNKQRLIVCSFQRDHVNMRLEQLARKVKSIIATKSGLA